MKDIKVKVCVTDPLGVSGMLKLGYIVLLDATSIDPPTEKTELKINRRVYVTCPYPSPFTQMVRVWVSGKGGEELSQNPDHSSRFYVEGMDTSVTRNGLMAFLEAALIVIEGLAPCRCLDELDKAFFDLHGEVSRAAAD